MRTNQYNFQVRSLNNNKDWESIEPICRAADECRLDRFSIGIYGNGAARYKAYDKETGGEFWTDEFNLNLV